MADDGVVNPQRVVNKRIECQEGLELLRTHLMCSEGPADLLQQLLHQAEMIGQAELQFKPSKTRVIHVFSDVVHVPEHLNAALLQHFKLPSLEAIHGEVWQI